MVVRRNVGGLWNMHAVTRRVPECSVCRKVRMTPHGSSHKRVSDVEDLMSHDQRDDDQSDQEANAVSHNVTSTIGRQV